MTLFMKMTGKKTKRLVDALLVMTVTCGEEWLRALLG